MQQSDPIPGLAQNGSPHHLTGLVISPTGAPSSCTGALRHFLHRAAGEGWVTNVCEQISAQESSA